MKNFSFRYNDRAKNRKITYFTLNNFLHVYQPIDRQSTNAIKRVVVRLNSKYNYSEYDTIPNRYGSVGESGQYFVVGDDDECLTQFIPKPKKQLMQVLGIA